MKTPARARILETADRLFSAKGYGNVGINEIIAQSGTAKASFYQHFPSKEMLCATWLAERHRLSEAQWEEILKAPGSPEKKILGQFDALKSMLEQSGHRGCPFTNTGGFLDQTNETAGAQIERHKQAQRAFFIALAAQLTSPAQSRKLGSALFLLYSGASVESRNSRQSWPVDAARDAARALLRAFAKTA